MNSLTPQEKEVLRMLEPLSKYLRSTWSPALLSKLTVDDILQETFFRAAAAFGTAKFENDKMFMAWLKKIASNVAISHIRRKGVSTTSLPMVSSSGLAQQLLESGELSPTQNATADENRRLLTLAIAKLPDKHQKIVRLRYDQQLQFEEIAIDLETTAAAVRGLHRNALEMLRHHMGDMVRFLSSR